MVRKMVKGAVLLCALAMTPNVGECGEKNAIAVIRVPMRFADPVQCLVQSQFFAAASVTPDENNVTKIMCTPERDEQAK
jgi:hypothetical protein